MSRKRKVENQGIWVEKL